MTDDALLWTAKRPVSRQPQPGEALWTIDRSGHHIACELRDHREVRCEVQLFRNGELWKARMFPSREMAIQAAEHVARRLSRPRTNVASCEEEGAESIR